MGYKTLYFARTNRDNATHRGRPPSTPEATRLFHPQGAASMSTQPSRRHFLATAASAAAFASSSSFAQESNRLVVGVMGTGGRGTGLATTFARQPGITVGYVCDTDAARAQRAAQQVATTTQGQAPQVVPDFRRILDDRSVDVLVCAAPNHWHAPATILACAAGKHVYVEKPCCHNPREGEWMVAAARRHNRKVQMGNQRRSWPKVIEGINAVRDGSAIGRCYYAHCWYLNNRPSTGRSIDAPVPQGLDYDLWQGPAPRRPFKSNYLPYTWHWFWHWGNGEVGNNGVHMIDVARWGLGVDFPTRVSSTGGRYRWEDDQETPDTNIVTLEYPGRKMIQWEGLSCNRFPASSVPDVLFEGENGMLAISGGGYTVYDAQGRQTRRETGDSGDPIHLRNFLEACRGNGRLNSEIEEGYKSTLPCHLANIAYRVGHSINCDPSNGHILRDDAAARMWGREYHEGWEQRLEAATR
jgi:predicted dehydrogenase